MPEMATYTVRLSTKGEDGEHRAAGSHSFQASDEEAAKREATEWAVIHVGMAGRTTCLRLFADDAPVWCQTFGEGR